MTRLLLLSAALTLAGCSTLPPTHDPEGCDRVSEADKRAGSDLVVDGDLFCATDEGNCVLTPSRIISGKSHQTLGEGKLAVHILRNEAEAYTEELAKRGELSLCYSPELWFPSAGRYRGRFYLREEAQRSYRMAYRPRTKD